MKINNWQFTVDSNFQKQIEEKYLTTVVFPPQQLIYRGFELTDLTDVKVVIFGQDPYHQPGVANGLAFSSDIKIPPSLKNLYKELADDLEITRTSGDLSDWAKQGVLLLNTSLTVESGKAGSHSKLGWMKVVLQAIEQINHNCENVVFVLMGNHAQGLKQYIGANQYIIEVVHPSPLSAYRGFFGCKLFSQINQLLLNSGKSPIQF